MVSDGASKASGLGAAARWDTGTSMGLTQERSMDYPVSRKVMALFTAFAKQPPGVEPRLASDDSAAVQRVASELTDSDARALPDEMGDMLRRVQCGQPPPAFCHPAVLLATLLTLKDQKRVIDVTEAVVMGPDDFVVARRPGRRKSMSSSRPGATRKTGARVSKKELESFLRGYVGSCSHCGENAGKSGTHCPRCGLPY